MRELAPLEPVSVGSKSFLSLAQQKASRTATKHKAFPSIWIRARNMGLFPSLVLAALIAKMAKQQKTQITTKKPRNPEQLQIDFNIPWGFFHGACQGVPALCQIGAVLYLNQSHVYWMRYAMGRGTNTKAELSVLCTLLHLASSVGIEKIQIMGYSKAAVDWANAKSSLENMRLDNVKKEGQRLSNLLDWKIIIHIFRELNQKAYELSITPVSIVQTEVMDGQEIGSMSCRFG